MSDPEANVDPLTDARPVYEVDVPATALFKLAVVVIGTVLVLTALSRAQRLAGLAVAAVVVAALLAPFVRLVARLVGRVAATVVVHVALLVATLAGTAVVVQAIQVESAALEQYTEDQIAGLADDGDAGFVSEARLDDRLGDALSTWGFDAVVGDDEAGGIASRLSELIILIVFSAFFSLQSDALLAMVLGWRDDRDERRVLRDVWHRSGSAATTYTLRALLVGALGGLVAAGVAASFGMPAVMLIGLGAGAMSMVPLLGPVVGWSPIVLIAVLERSTTQAIVVSVIAFVVIVLTAAVRRRVLTTPFHPGTFVVTLGLAAGLSAGQLPGALVGMFLAVGLAAAASHDWTVDRLSVASSGQARPSQSSLVRTAEHGSGGDAFDDDERTADRLLLQASRGTLLRVTAIVVVAFSLQLSVTSTGPTVIWAVVGILIAIGLDRPVSWVHRRFGVRRSVSVVVGALVVGAAIGALAATAAGSFDGSTGFDTDLSAVADSLMDVPIIGERLSGMDMEERIAGWQADLSELLSSSSTVDTLLTGVGGGLVAAFWILVVAITGLLDGPRIVSAIDRRVPARFRRQVGRLSRAGHGALAGYVAGSAVVAALNGAIVGTMAAVVGVPAPVVMAVWAFGWNFVPQIGAVIGWAPALLLALLVGPVPGFACIGFFVVYQIVENNLIQPTIVGQAVDLSPLAALAAALVGVAVAGLLGAVLAIPLAGVARAVVTEWRRDDFPAIRRASASRASSVPVDPT